MEGSGSGIRGPDPETGLRAPDPEAGLRTSGLSDPDPGSRTPKSSAEIGSLWT